MQPVKKLELYTNDYEKSFSQYYWSCQFSFDLNRYLPDVEQTIKTKISKKGGRTNKICSIRFVQTFEIEFLHKKVNIFVTAVKHFILIWKWFIALLIN